MSKIIEHPYICVFFPKAKIGSLASLHMHMIMMEDALSPR